MAWEDGFKIGYETSKIEIPSMSASLAQYQKSIDAKRQLAAQQKANEQAYRSKVVEAVGEEALDIFTENFDDTGIFEYDVASDKLELQYRKTTEYNTWLYRNGLMSEDKYRMSQRTLKANVNGFKDIYKDINTKNETDAQLQKEGKGNVVNGFRSELLALYGEHFSMSTRSDGGINASTLVNGEVVTMPASTFKSLTGSDVGADLDAALKEILDDKGYSEYFNKDASKKIMDYTLNTQNVSKLVDIKANGFTEAQVIDAAIKLGVLSTDVKDREENPNKYIDPVKWLTYDKEKIDNLRDDVSAAMVEYTYDKYALQQGSRVFKPEKQKEEESLFEIGVTTMKDPGIEYSTGVDPTKEYDADTLLGTMITAQGISLANDDVKSNVNSLSDKDAFRKKNYDLYDGENYMGNNPDKPIKINAISIPSGFNSKDITSLGVSSQSDKDWSSVDGLVIVKGRTKIDPKTGNPLNSVYNFRLHGSIEDSSSVVKEETGVKKGSDSTAKEGAGTYASVVTTDTTKKQRSDVSLPISDAKLPNAWEIFVNKNKDIKAEYMKVYSKFTRDGYNIKDPIVFRDMVGETLEQFYTK